MGNLLRILNLEDDIYDAELIQQQLTGDGRQVEFVRVADEASFRQELEHTSYDLILADNSIPGFDGRSALHLVKEIAVDIPFIFVSGTLGEELAIESLKDGAADYVLKQRLGRLPSVVTRALQQSEERRRRQAAEAAIRQSEERFRALIENSSDAILLLRQDGKIIYVSPSTERILGYAPEEILGQDPLTYIHPDDLPGVLAILTEVLQHPQQVYRSEYRVRCKDGCWCWIETAINNLTNEPNIAAIIFNYHDISEQKQAAEELASANRHLRILFDHLDQVLFSVDVPNQKLLQISPACEQVYGVPSKAFLDDPDLWRSMLHPDDRERISEKMEWLSANNDHPDFFRILRPDGAVRWVEIKITPTHDPQGEIIRIDGIVSDVTQQRLANEEIQRRIAHQTALNSIILNASRVEVGLDDLLMNALKLALKAFDLHKGGIWVENHPPVFQGLSEKFSNCIDCLANLSAKMETGTLATRNWDSVTDTGMAKIRQTMLSHGIHASLSTPLSRDREQVGGIILASEHPRTWSPDETMLLKAIGSQLGIIIERTRLLEETRNHVNELEDINRISTALRAAITLDEILPALLDEILVIFNSSSGSIWLYDESTKMIQPVATHAPETSHGHTFKGVRADEGIAGYVFSTGNLYSTMDLRNDSHITEANRRLIPSGASGMAVPIRSEAAMLGVLFIHFPQSHEFTSDELRLMRTLTEIAGNTIQRLQLFKQTQVQVQRLTALRAIDTAINNSFNLPVILGVILEEACQQLDVDASDVLLLDSQKMELKYSTARGFQTALIGQSKLDVHASYAGQAVLDQKIHGQSAISNNSLILGAKNYWPLKDSSPTTSSP